MQINLKLPYNKGAESVESDIETSANIIQGAVHSAYPKGFDGNGPMRRMFGRIQRKIDAVLENQENGMIEFEEAEIDFLKKCIERAELPAYWSKHIMLFEDELDKTESSLPGSQQGDVAPTQPDSQIS